MKSMASFASYDGTEIGSASKGLRYFLRWLIK
jgi:hypothetical protein